MKVNHFCYACGVLKRNIITLLFSNTQDILSKHQKKSKRAKLHWSCETVYFKSRKWSHSKKWKQLLAENIKRKKITFMIKQDPFLIVKIVDYTWLCANIVYTKFNEVHKNTKQLFSNSRSNPEKEVDYKNPYKEILFNFRCQWMRSRSIPVSRKCHVQ